MREISSDITFEVPAGEVASVRVAHSATLVVHDGIVWLTRSDDTADYWLEPGHKVRLRRGERLWVGAERDAARVAFETPARAGDRALDWLMRGAAHVGLRAGSGWRTV
ncbi:MAG TPA: DUF2917 domain-containing protein [Paraburkholderia sp.]|jgi:hypothetical protein|nr:DUF2917 domain-containing protein [Paraburkholderia sp.]